MRQRAADIVIAGAGPAGATMARLLALRGRRVLLVDPGTRQTGRLEVVAPSACRVVEAAGLAHLLHDASMARPCLGIRRRWGTAEIEIDDFLRRPGGRGFVIDRAPFDSALRVLAMDAGATCVTGRVVAAQRNSGEMIVEIESGAQSVSIGTGLIVDATGRPSAVARRLGAQRLVSERRIAGHRFIGTTLASVRDPGWLDVESSRDGGHGGWWYEVSGPDGRRERWDVYRAERNTPDRARACADASSALLSRAAGEGWIAIGDAAASFDPITSQGLANALSTALVAAGAILSPASLDENARRIYSDAVAATFQHSEAGRARVYAALAN